MMANYVSKHTGAQIDAAVEKVPVLEEGVATLSKEMAGIKESSGETITEVGTVINVEASEGNRLNVSADTTDAVTLVHQGKNFAPEFPPYDKNGLKGIQNADGTYTLKGENSSGTELYLTPVPNTSPMIFPAGPYIVTTNLTSSSDCKINIAKIGESKPFASLSTGVATFMLEEPTELFWYLFVGSGTVVNQTFWMQIERGNTASEYEAHWRESWNEQLPINAVARDGVNILYTESGETLTVNITRDLHNSFVMLKNDVNEIKKEIVSPINGKIFNALGDSITSVGYTTPTWWEMIADKAGSAFNNYGVSGTSIAVREGRTDSFVERAARMDAAADAVIVMGGTNDSATPRGAWDSTDSTTFFGALNNLIVLLCDAYQGKPIIICTPIQTANDFANNVHNPAETLMSKTDTDNLTMQQRAAAIKLKCEQYGMHCLDLYNGSGIGGADNGNVYYRDGDSLHPSEYGQKRLANLMRRELERFFGIE